MRKSYDFKDSPKRIERWESILGMLQVSKLQRGIKKNSRRNANQVKHPRNF